MAIQMRSGVPSAAANGKNGHTLISDDKFRQLYALTLKVCLLPGRADGTSSLRGFAGALAGIAADLCPQDVVVLEPAMRDAAALREDFRGKLSAPAAAAFKDCLVEAVGKAVIARMQGTRGISVVFSPAGLAEGTLVEAHAMAVRAKLPLLFVESAGTSAANSSSRRANGSAGAGEGAMPAIPVDAQDVVAIYRVAHESIARAREGSGPTRVLCISGQLPVSGRGAPASAGSDAVEHLERWLAGRGLPAQQWRRKIVAEIEKARAAQNAGQKADRAPEGRSETEDRHPQTTA